MSNTDFTALAAGFAGILVVIGIFLLALFVFALVCTYKMYQKAGHPNAWLVFLIFPAFVPFFHVINRSSWNVLWVVGMSLLMQLPDIAGSSIIISIVAFVAAIVYLVFFVRWTLQFLDAYGMNRLWILLMIFVPLGKTVLYGYMAFSKDVQYKGTLYQRA